MEFIDRELFAFWQYDTYPYLLGGTITQMDDQGRIETVEYGHGNWFRPVKILPVKAGQELMRQICELTKKRDAAFLELTADWDINLKSLVGD